MCSFCLVYLIFTYNMANAGQLSHTIERFNIVGYRRIDAVIQAPYVTKYLKMKRPLPFIFELSSPLFYVYI